MTDVFISYARTDSIFVQRLHNMLVQNKREIWVDWESIPLTANWWQEICAGIDATNTFVFVISPAAIASPICNIEVAYAIENNKRLVPIVLTETDEKIAFEALGRTPLDDLSQSILGERDMLTVARRNWLSLARHNWLFFHDETQFNENYQRLLNAIDTDLQYVQMHTNLLVRAREWHDKGRKSSFLLNGSGLQEAKFWLTASEGKSPQPTQLHIAYIVAGQDTAKKRQRILFTLATIAFAVMFVLAAVAFMLYQAALESLQYANATEHVLQTDMAHLITTNDAYEMHFIGQISPTP